MDSYLFRSEYPETINIQLLAITSLFIAGKFE